MILLGSALGFFIGIVSGVVVVLLIRTAITGATTLRTTLVEITQLLALPTFCFGGPWLTQRMLSSVDLAGLLPTYATSLAVSFVLVAGYPLAMLIIATGNRVARTGRRR